LVEDGSPDNCGEICDEYRLRDERVKVIHQKNSGVSAARNTGLAQVQGKYLTFIDSDDRLVSNAWEIALKKIQKSEADCIVFGWKDFTAEGEITDHQVTNKDITLDASEMAFQIASDNFLCGGGYPWNKIWNAEKIRREYGNIVKFTDRVYTYEDKLWIIEVLEKMDRIILIPDVLYEYRYLPSSLTQSPEKWEKRQFNAYDAYDIILDKLRGKNEKAYRGALKFYFGFNFTDLRNMYPYRKDDIERFKKTKRRLWKLSKRIKMGELPNFKYNLAWLYFLLLGWL
jgi:glycosyltransferase involved in cell wall biosynthesis